MKKLIVGILVLSLCVVAFAVVARNIIIKTVVIKGIEAATGLKVEMGKVDIGLLDPVVEIDSLKVYNPAGFGDTIMADIPQIYVAYDLGGFFQNRVHLTKLRLDIKELAVVVNERGTLNLNSLALIVPKPGNQSTTKPPVVSIDELDLKVGKVTYQGTVPGTGVKNAQFNATITETFHDVTNPAKVAGEILQKILTQIGLSDLAHFDVGAQTAQVKGALDSAKKDLQNLLPK